MIETIRYTPRWTVHRFVDHLAYQKWLAGNPEGLICVSRFDGNLLLNEGITRLLNLLIGGGGTAYNNANAQLGVGNSATAVAATQTGLQGASKAFVGMEAGFPSISGQTVSFKSVFDGSTANFAWEEFTARNGATADENLNRKVSSQGTKTSGQTWTLTLDITFS